MIFRWTLPCVVRLGLCVGERVGDAVPGQSGRGDVGQGHCEELRVQAIHRHVHVSHQVCLWSCEFNYVLVPTCVWSCGSNRVVACRPGRLMIKTGSYPKCPQVSSLAAFWRTPPTPRGWRPSPRGAAATACRPPRCPSPRRAPWRPSSTGTLWCAGAHGRGEIQWKRNVCPGED